MNCTAAVLEAGSGAPTVLGGAGVAAPRACAPGTARRGALVCQPTDHVRVPTVIGAHWHPSVRLQATWLCLLMLPPSSPVAWLAPI